MTESKKPNDTTLQQQFYGRNRYAVAVYLCIGLIGIVLVLIPLLREEEGFAGLSLNLGTELIGGALIFFTLRYFFLDNDYAVKEQLERIEEAINTSQKKFLIPPIDNKIILDKLANADKLSICGYELVRFVEKTEPILEKLLRNGAEIRFLVVSEYGMGHDLMIRYDSTPIGTHNPLRTIEFIRNLKKRLEDNKIDPKISIKTIDWIPSCSLLITEETGGVRWLNAEIYPPCFDTISSERATFQLTNDDEWFAYFSNQFEQLWKWGDVFEISTSPK